MIVDLVDGTYELFRHFYGQRRFNKGVDKPTAATVAVLNTILQMLEADTTHVGVATDHVVESFRNELYDGYKTGEGMEPVLLAQFHPMERALASMGVAVWPMKELEADDGLASAARIAAKDKRVTQVRIWTPDKDLGQSVVGDRVVQVDRKSGAVRNAQGVREKFGVDPEFIPDLLALVGDSADGYPGVAGIGGVTATKLINEHGHLEKFPAAVLGANKKDALLFKKLATLRDDAPLFKSVDELEWKGPTAGFSATADELGKPQLVARVEKLLRKRAKAGKA